MFQPKKPITSPKEAIQFARENGAEMVDLRFIDLPGIWQHTSVPIQSSQKASRTHASLESGGIVSGCLPQGRMSGRVTPAIAGSSRPRSV